MTSGSEFQEVAEAPEVSQEISEAQEDLNLTVNEPAEVVELKADVKLSDDNQKEFEAVVNAVQSVESAQPSPATPTGEDSGGKSDFGTDSSQLGDEPEAGSAQEDKTVTLDPTPRDDLEKVESLEVLEGSDPTVIPPGDISDDRATEVEVSRILPDTSDNPTSSSLGMLAQVSAEKAETAAQDLEDIAARQAENLKAKQKVRESQQTFDEILGDDPTADQLEVEVTELPAAQVSKLDDLTYKLGTVEDEVGDFRVPGKHPTKIEPLPGRTPSGDHTEIPADADGLGLHRTEDPPGYDPNAKPEKNSQNESDNAPTDADESRMEARRILPFSSSPAGLRKFTKDTDFIISNQLGDSADNPGKLTLDDLVLSVLPWPYQKELPSPTGSSEEDTDGIITSQSIPIVTLLSLDLLNEILALFKNIGLEDPDLEQQLTEMEDIINKSDNLPVDNSEHDQFYNNDDELVEDLYQFAVQLRNSENRNTESTQEDSKKITLSDLVLSTLPWPYHKELPDSESGHDLEIDIPEDFPFDRFFKWIPYILSYIPILGLEGKSDQDDYSDDD